MKLSFNRLEDVLLAKGYINKEQHNEIREYIKQNKISSAVAISSLEIMNYNDIYSAIAEIMGVEFVSVADSYNLLDDKVISLVSEDICRAFNILPWALEDGKLKILIENPQNTAAIKEVKDWTGKEIVPVMAVGKQLKNIIDHYFNNRREKEKMRSLVNQGTEVNNVASAAESFADGTGPIVEFINMLLEQAANSKASDIHIKPKETDVNIRMRIDGELREIMS